MSQGMRSLNGLAALLMMAGAAQAATVQVTGGSVSLNKGNGFTAIVGAAEALPGDTVMTGANGEADIVYANGCTVHVGPSQSATIGEPPVCNAAGLAAPGTGTMLGAVVIVGAVAGAVVFGVSNSNDKPASP